MANKTMHHVVIGSDTYEIVDEQGRANVATNTQDISSLKEDLSYSGIGNAFNGQLSNSYWNASGVLVSYSGDVCNTVKIPCKEGDKIKLFTSPAISDVDLYASFFDSAGTTRLQRDTRTGTDYEGIAPTGASYFCFTYEKTGLTKDSFNSVFVYINHSIDELKGQFSDLKNGLKNTIDLIEYNNIVVPQFDEKSANTASSTRVTVSNVVNVSSGKTYFGYALLNISNLSGYTSSTMYLEFINSLDFVVSGKKAGDNLQPIQNGDIELYGSFTPSSNGTVKAVIYMNNIATNYTFTATIKKLYLFESSADLSSLCASVDYSDVLAYSEIKDGTITADDLDYELRNKISPVDTAVIDCWGDSLTAGAGSTSVTYPSRLQTLIGGNFTVNNYGQGSETAEAVAFRQGGLNGIVEPFTASTSYVTVNSLISVDGSSLGTLNLQGTYYGNNVVTINGTNYFYRRVDKSHCKFARISESSNPTYTRPMLVKAEGKGIHHILIICVGQNGWISTDPNALANIIQKMVDYNAYDKYIVVGIPTGNASSKCTEEQTLGSVFGNHFVNAREYISAWGCSDNNITPTAEDTEAMEIGAIPPSLRADSVHLNDYGYTAMGNCIYQRGVSLGYWT